PQIVVFVTDNYPDVATFPRYYIDPKQRNYLRFKASKTVLLPAYSQCSTAPEHRGRATCYIQKFLRNRLIRPFNCTVFYLRHKNPELDICEPKLLVENYNTVDKGSFGIEGKRGYDLLGLS
ncbi:Protein DEL-7, partial [Aphelenchoides avenae]